MMSPRARAWSMPVSRWLAKPLSTAQGLGASLGSMVKVISRSAFAGPYFSSSGSR
jgi:hypothetical protein